LRSFFRDIGLPVVLLGASIVTTSANGARFMQNFLDGMPPVVRDSDPWPWPWLVLGFFALAILVLTITPTPFYDSSLKHFLR
jgi:hypothetical protein